MPGAVGTQQFLFDPAEAAERLGRTPMSDQLSDVTPRNTQVQSSSPVSLSPFSQRPKKYTQSQKAINSVWPLDCVVTSLFRFCLYTVKRRAENVCFSIFLRFGDFSVELNGTPLLCNDKYVFYFTLREKKHQSCCFSVCISITFPLVSQPVTYGDLFQLSFIYAQNIKIL